MRILLATDWNRGRGGAETQALLLRDGLTAAGDEVRLLTGSAGSAGDGSADYVAFASERLAAQAFLQLVNPFAVACARRAVRDFAPEVALVNMFAQQLSPAFVHALGAVPLVILVSDYKCVCPMGTKLLPDGSLCEQRAGIACLASSCVGPLHWLRDQPRYALLRSAMARASRVLTCSGWMRSRLRADGIEAEVLPLPVPAPRPDFRRAPDATPTFLCLGRLDVEKGVDLLLRAFARVRAEVRDARLRIVGRGPQLPALQALARELVLEDRIEFVGWLDATDIDAELSRAWALVAPALWAEPFGLVAPEAILRGVPVIASASGGFAETVVEQRSGLLFPNGDEEALAERLLRVANRQAFPGLALAPEVIAEASERYSIARYVERLRAILRGALADTV